MQCNISEGAMQHFRECEIMTMVSITLELLITALTFESIVKECQGDLSCHKKVIGLHENGYKNLFRSSNTSEVWMDSTMFCNILRWKNREGFYNVYYKYHLSAEWIPVETCVNTSRSSCEIDQIEPSLCYDIKVEETTTKSKSIALGSIHFYPEYETKLLPLEFQATRVGKILFIRPNTDQYKQIKKYIRRLHFQIKYWMSFENGTADSNPSVKKFPFQHSSEVTIAVDRPDVTYCMTSRLRLRHYYSNETENSGWGKVVCLERNRSDETSSGYTIAIAVGVSFFFLICLLLQCALRKYKKIIKADKNLPQYLAAVKQEMEDLNTIQKKKQSLTAIEKADPIDGNNCYVTLNSSVFIQPLFVDIDWGVRSHKRKTSTYSDTCYHEVDSLWHEECDDMDDIDGGKATNRDRVRSRSRGYHSFSSDDVTTDDNATLPYEEARLEMDYVNATAAFLANTGGDSEPRLSSGRCNSSREGDYVWSVETPMTSRYVNTGKNSCVRDAGDRRQFRRNESDSFLLLNRHLPCENVTYCSHLYGNIPDALVARNPAEYLE